MPYAGEVYDELMKRTKEPKSDSDSLFSLKKELIPKVS